MVRPGLIFAFLVAGLPGAAQADYSTTINPQTTWGAWEGWGASLCWWANVFGARNDLADIVFTTNYTSLNGQTLPGLGMNIARYNAGACGANSINGETMQASPNIPAFRQMAGYWLDWFNSDAASASWNWMADANQRSMLLNAKARGANLLELFSNSPMWWMCYNHNPAGADNGGNDNLQSWNYQQHAVYLATVARYASDHWGITFDSVEPFNEPIANWWSATGTQEGCHFDTGTQAAVLGQVRTELDNRGLTTVKVAASDESLYDQARSTWNSYGAATKAAVGRVNVHGYQYGGGRRDLLYTAVAGKRLWNSEYGESDASGVSLASNLNLDFRWLHPTAWCYWQPFDSGGWGLIQSNPGDNWIGNANPKYYVLAHYTRHIRPGMTIIDGGEGNTVAAYHAAARKLVIVTMNYDVAQTITYNLSNFFNAAGPVRRWVTMTGSGWKYARLSDAAVNGKVFAATFATNTIQTFEVQNVDINAPLRLAISRPSGDGQILLSWPDWATAYKLYSTTNPAFSGDWLAVPQPPISSNGNLNVLLSPANTLPQFYRLSNH
jgi:galactan endo-1,6-beta-galactosidase